MKKSVLSRVLTGITAAFIAVSAGSLSVFADNNTPATPGDDTDKTTFTDGILTYKMIEDTRFVEIVSCVSTATNVNILPEMDGYTVSSIADGAFAGCSELQSVTFPMDRDLTTIGAYAFAECSSLKSVKLPNTVKEIPTGMFAYCSALEEVTFGNSVTYIGDEAFRECTSLTSIDLPDTLTSTGGYVFYMCTSLENVDVPESLESIGSYSFMGCMELTSFNVSENLVNMGDAPFLGCMSLTDITVDENNPNYIVKDGIIYSKDETILYFYPPSREDNMFTVPEGIVDVYDGAFFQCVNLEAVILPGTLTTIGASAFDYCSGLKSVTIPKSVTHIMNAAFADCTSLEAVVFEGAEDENGGEGENLVIESNAFYVCESLKEVVLPKRVTAIGENAFGVTEIKDSSGNPIPTAIDGFGLHGYEVAEKYAKDNEVKIGFSPRHFPWKKVIFWVIGGAAVIVLVYFAAVIVKKNMMTPEEKEALKQAKAEEKAAKAAAETEAEETPVEDGYKSILGDDEDEEEVETEEQQAAKEAAEVERFRGAGGITHFRGHGE